MQPLTHISQFISDLYNASTTCFILLCSGKEEHVFISASFLFIIPVTGVGLTTAASSTRHFALLSGDSGRVYWCDMAFTKTPVSPAAALLAVL